MLEALLLALLAAIASIDEQVFGASMMGRPLIISPIVGFITGDITQGFMIGASLELMFMGAIMVGSATPPEVSTSSVLGTSIAIMSGQGVGTAVALAVPISIFMQMWKNTCYAFAGNFACKKAIEAIKQHNVKKAIWLHWTILPCAIGIPAFLLIFCSTYYGVDTLNTMINAIPESVLHGFDVAAGVLPAIGLALLIKMMGNRKLLPYLFLGFIAVMYVNMDVIGVAVAGLCFALLAVNKMQFEKEEEL